MAPDYLISKLFFSWICFFLFGFNVLHEIKAQKASNNQVDSVQNSSTLYAVGPALTDGNWINPDSVKQPQILSLGPPKTHTIYTNVFPAGKPEVVSIPGELPIIIPGKNGIPLPRLVEAKGRVVTALQPPPTPALAPEMKSNAIANFQHLNMLQGMTSPSVGALVEDKFGNIWFGNIGGGLTRYDGQNFVHYDQGEGLPDNSIYSMMEDSHGNIWFGTDFENGVTRYDGQNFTHFSDEEGFTSYTIRDMMEDSKGNLWFGTVGGGVIQFDGQSFTHFTTTEGLSNNVVLAILEDRHGIFWFGTRDGGVVRYDGKEWINITSKEGLCNNTILYILEDSKGKIWFGSDGGGICCLEGDQLLTYSTGEGLSHNKVEAIMEDKPGNIWFGTNGGGATKFDGHYFTHYTQREGFTNAKITEIILDRQGNLWFSTSNAGVIVYRSNTFTYFNGDGTPQIEDKQGNLIAQSQGGLKFFNYDDNSYLHYALESVPADISYGNIIEDQDGNLLTGIHRLGLYKYNGQNIVHYSSEQGLRFNDVGVMSADLQGNIWIGSSYQGIYKYDGTSFTNTVRESWLRSPEVVCTINTILGDSHGQVWIGTMGGGVSKFDGQHFTDFNKKDGLSSGLIITIKEDSKGNIWIGTFNGGLNIYNGESFVHLDKNDGLTDNMVWSVIEDNLGRLWVGTKRGLDLLIPLQKEDTSSTISGPDDFRIINFKKEDGLKSMGVSEGFLDSKNRIWWENMMLDLNQYELPTEPPAIHLDYLELEQTYIDYRRLDNEGYLKSVDFRKHLDHSFDSIASFYNYPIHLELPHQVNHLTFHFSAIYWVVPHKLKYQFMLEGQDNGWNPVTTDNEADYRGLSPGSYTFKIKAAGQNLVWSEPFEYAFTILPPWWLTWWAKLSYTLLGIMAVLSYVRWRTSALKKRQKVLEQTVMERTAEVVEQKEEAEKQKERAERSEKYKEQFLANMSHEIRTPMNAISGMVRILKRNEHPPTQDKFLNAISQSSDNMLVILNDILDLSKIEAGKIEIESIPVNLQRIIENVIDILRFKAEEKGLLLTYTIADEVPALIMGDPTRLNQILMNLVGNAIKFTPDGKVEIKVELDEKSKNLRFAVKDSGIGIPADKLESIFGTFEQADDSTTRVHGGTGLGLSICKQLVELQHGKIWVESAEGQGSTFLFELPLIKTDSEIEAKPAVSQAQLQEMAKALSGIRILLAEDNAFNVMLAKDDLAYHIPNIQVDIAENGQIALEKFESGNYDLILMDVQMPELNGLEASTQIREIEAANGQKERIPIIAMTASLLKTEIQQCYDAGMDNYVPKPYKIEELIGTMYEEVGR